MAAVAVCPGMYELYIHVLGVEDLYPSLGHGAGCTCMACSAGEVLALLAIAIVSLSRLRGVDLLPVSYLGVHRLGLQDPSQ